MPSTFLLAPSAERFEDGRDRKRRSQLPDGPNPASRGHCGVTLRRMFSRRALTGSLPPPAPPQSPDAKKEEFRKYLERSGVIDALTKVLVGLYEEPEKPSNAIECATRLSHTQRDATPPPRPRAREREKEQVSSAAAWPASRRAGLGTQVHQNDAWRADGRRRGSAQGGERDATCRGGSATRKGWRARGEVGRCGGGGVEGRRLDPLRRTPLCSPCMSIYLLRLAAALCVCQRVPVRLFDEPSLVAREYVHSWNAELHATRRTTTCTLVLALPRGIMNFRVCGPSRLSVRAVTPAARSVLRVPISSENGKREAFRLGPRRAKSQRPAPIGHGLSVSLYQTRERVR